MNDKKRNFPKKGIWINIKEENAFLEREEELSKALERLGFDMVGVPAKTRYGSTPFQIFDKCVEKWRKNGLKVFAWVIGMIDESVPEKYYVKDSKGEAIGSYLCPEKALNEKNVDYEGEKITYASYLKKIVSKLTRYPLEGVNLLEFRYPAHDACKCELSLKKYGLKEKEIDFEDVSILERWVEGRVETIKNMWSQVTSPLDNSEIRKIGNAKLDFESFGRLGERVFHGVDFNWLTQQSNALSILQEAPLERTFDPERLKKFFQYAGYLHQETLQVLQFLGISEYEEYRKVKEEMSKIKLPYYILVPNSRVLINWSKES